LPLCVVEGHPRSGYALEMRSSTALALVSATVLAAGCATPLTTRARFDTYGEYGAAKRTEPTAAGPDQVRVFMGTAPDGFSLRENELKVEPGFDHHVLGRVRVVYKTGYCWDGGATQRDVIAQMKAEAYHQGGDAIIYALSAIETSPTPGELCQSIRDREDLGAGWVVVLGDRQPAATADAQASGRGEDAQLADR
jgi:hypothetical protein